MSESNRKECRQPAYRPSAQVGKIIQHHQHVVVLADPVKGSLPVVISSLLLQALAAADIVPTRRELAVLKVAGFVWVAMIGIPSLLLLSGLT